MIVGFRCRFFALEMGGCAVLPSLEDGQEKVESPDVVCFRADRKIQTHSISDTPSRTPMCAAP